MHVTSASAEETERVAADLAARLRPGDVVGVSGELGAGKTTFVRGAARALGVAGPVASPTFTIGHRYDAPVPVAHLDLYRVAHLDPGGGGGGDPSFEGTILFVGGREPGGGWLPPVRARVTREHVDEPHRRIR